MRDLFRAFLIMRPLAIIVYTSMTTVLTVHKANFTLKQLRMRKMVEIEEETMEAAKQKQEVIDQQADLMRGVSVGSDNLKKDDMDLIEAIADENYELRNQLDDMFQPRKRNVDEEIEFEHPEIPTSYESMMTLFLMPVILYCGFGRALIASEKKSTILQGAYA